MVVGIFRNVSKRLILVVLCLSWYAYSTWQLYKAIRTPLAPATSADGLPYGGVRTIFTENQLLDLHVYLSQSPETMFDLPTSYNAVAGHRARQGENLAHVGSLTVPYGWNTEHVLQEKAVQTKKSFALVSLDPVATHHLNFTLPEEFRQNATLFIHVVCAEHNTSTLVVHPTVIQLSRLLTFPQEREQRPKRYLISHPLRSLLSLNSMPNSLSTPEYHVKRRLVQGVPQAFLVGLVVEDRPLDATLLTRLGLGRLIDEKRQKILLPVVVNKEVAPRDSWMPLVLDNDNPHEDQSSSGIIRLTYSPISFLTWNLRMIVDNTLDILESKYNMPAYDIDSLKMLVLGASVWLSCLTFGISVFHLLFEFLAMSSDIQFWMDRTSFTEFSVTSIRLEVINEIIIGLYLRDCGESKLLQYFVLFRVFVNIWKLSKFSDGCFGFAIFKKKAVGVEVTSEEDKLNDENTKDSHGDGGNVKARVDAHRLNVTKDELNDFEWLWMRRLLLALAPIILSVSLYQLFYVQQRGWYSWAIRSLALCAYGGGFVAMTPQLFRNYKLKTVAHLPWHALTYQAVNTFVDDIFSFIIRMPDMHRVSVFRDDIVFFVFHYQRWLYRKPKDEGHSDEAQRAETKKIQ